MKTTASIVCGLALVGGLLAAQKNESKCWHCGSASYGAGCHHSPTGKHEHRDDSTRCEWCGSVSYGAGCHHSPTSKHRHGLGEASVSGAGRKSTAPVATTARHGST